MNLYECSGKGRYKNNRKPIDISLESTIFKVAKINSDTPEFVYFFYVEDLDEKIPERHWVIR